jgi:transcriptional regulator with XRE-family HTH domain
MIKEKFGSRIKELRMQANLSQEKFALMIDMDRTYLASVENGRRNISLENIYKIANGFHITLEELFKDMK